MFGAMISLCMPLPQLLITVINTIYAGSKKQLLLYNGILLVSSVAGIFVNSQLYFKYICYDADGVMVMWAELSAAVVLIVIYTAVEFLIRCFYDRKRVRT